MSGTALQVVADLGSYDGQRLHYAEVKRRLGARIGYVRPSPEAQASYNDLPPKPVRRGHQYIILTPEAPSDLMSHTQRIIYDVCHKYKVSKPELFGRQRSRNIVAARHEAFYRMKKETTLSLAQVGTRLGGRDHTTVISGIEAHMRRNGIE